MSTKIQFMSTKIQKTIKVIIEEKEYIVKFPNVGQLLDIENMKMALTNNTYADLVRSNLKTSFFATEIVDAIAHFWVLIPNFRADLDVKSYTDLDPFLAKKLVKIYKTQFQKWYDGLMAELMADEIGNDLPDMPEEEEDAIIKL